MRIKEQSVEKQVDALMFGCVFGDDGLEAAMRRELTERVKESIEKDEPLTVYTGYDASNPDLHLGHSITLRRMRTFQDFGHDVIFLIGTMTARVGDASDKLTGRPQKTQEDVDRAAATYAEQCFKILDRERTRVLYNADWLAKMTLADVITLASNFTVQQFLVRDNYAKRIEAGNPVGLHEFLYALLQGHDAVHLGADVQLGATEQLFNIMAGRKLQEVAGQKPAVCLLFPILTGTDGTLRMSKSTGNIVGIAEPPSEQFGKTMSISDDTMLEWIRYVTRWTPDEIERATEQVRSGELHPMELKKRLGMEIVSMYHGDAAAEEARANFEQVHQKGQDPDDMPEYVLEEPIGIIELLHAAQLAQSKSAARRLIQGRGVRIDREVVPDIEAVVDGACIVQVGKRQFLRVVRPS